MKPKKNNRGGAMDICQTPPHALEPLYPYLPKHWIIWESACGPERLIIAALEKHGYKVIGTDILYGQDRFNNPVDDYDVEITNVPFSIKYDWLAKAFDDSKPFAFLVPYETTAAGAFKKLVEKYNGKPWQIEKLTPERRINYKMPNKGWDSSAQMPTCWITWGLNIHHTKNVDDTLFEFYVPMRSPKYDVNNIEMEKSCHKLRK